MYDRRRATALLIVAVILTAFGITRLGLMLPAAACYLATIRIAARHL